MGTPANITSAAVVCTLYILLHLNTPYVCAYHSRPSQRDHRYAGKQHISSSSSCSAFLVLLNECCVHVYVRSHDGKQCVIKHDRDDAREIYITCINAYTYTSLPTILVPPNVTICTPGNSTSACIVHVSASKYTLHLSLPFSFQPT